MLGRSSSAMFLLDHLKPTIEPGGLRVEECRTRKVRLLRANRPGNRRPSPVDESTTHRHVRSPNAPFRQSAAESLQGSCCPRLPKQEITLLPADLNMPAVGLSVSAFQSLRRTFIMRSYARASSFRLASIRLSSSCERGPRSARVSILQPVLRRRMYCPMAREQ